MGQTDQNRRSDITGHRMIPAQQCLHAVQLSLAGDLGLVEQLSCPRFMALVKSIERVLA